MAKQKQSDTNTFLSVLTIFRHHQITNVCPNSSHECTHLVPASVADLWEYVNNANKLKRRSLSNNTPRP